MCSFSICAPVSYTHLDVYKRQIQAYRPAPGGTHLPITHMEAGCVFGDVLGGSSLASPITVVAECPCEVLLLPYDRLLQMCIRDSCWSFWVS